MKDIVNSFKAHLYERTSSPLIGAFIFYWLISNYKMIVILFDDKLKSSEKFSDINSIYVNDLFYSIPLNGLIYPIIATLVYLLLFPFISNKIHKFWLKHQDNLKEISNNQLHTDKEFGELREDFMELQLKFNETFKSMNEEISEKNTLISKKDETIAAYEKTISDYKNRENKTIDEYRDILSMEVEEKYENEKSQKNHYILLLEPDNPVLKTLKIDEKIILYTIYKHKDKKIWNVLTASQFTKNEAGESLLEKGLIEKAEHEHYQLSEEGRKIFE